jgi:SAM-dependent methyltransferase
MHSPRPWKVSRAAARISRRLVPSTAPLTYNPVVSRLLNAADWPSTFLFPEFAKLPPNHLRVRVGVGNRLLFNHLRYLVGPKNFWMYVFARGFCALDATILDLGCGCGRYASHLRDFQVGPARFTGRYYGVDIDSEMVAWCQDNFDPERFAFFQALGRSTTYNRRDEIGDARWPVPLDDGSVDFVFSTSLFTHLLEEDLVHYVHETHRLLRPGGFTVHSFFSIDSPPSTFGGRHGFANAIGNAHVESLRQPEAAVAYTDRFVGDTLRRAGLSDIEFLTSGGQAFVVARAPHSLMAAPAASSA